MSASKCDANFLVRKICEISRLKFGTNNWSQQDKLKVKLRRLLIELCELITGTRISSCGENWKSIAIFIELSSCFMMRRGEVLKLKVEILWFDFEIWSWERVWLVYGQRILSWGFKSILKVKWLECHWKDLNLGKNIW